MKKPHDCGVRLFAAGVQDANPGHDERDSASIAQDHDAVVASFKLLTLQGLEMKVCSTLLTGLLIVGCATSQPTQVADTESARRDEFNKEVQEFIRNVKGNGGIDYLDDNSAAQTLDRHVRRLAGDERFQERSLKFFLNYADIYTNKAEYSGAPEGQLVKSDDTDIFFNVYSPHGTNPIHASIFAVYYRPLKTYGEKDSLASDKIISFTCSNTGQYRILSRHYYEGEGIVKSHNNPKKQELLPSSKDTTVELTIENICLNLTVK